MSPRVRKLIGLFAILAFMTAYVVGAAWLSERLPSNRLVELAYFVVAGTFWFLPILPLITWMSRER